MIVFPSEVLVNIRFCRIHINIAKGFALFILFLFHSFVQNKFSLFTMCFDMFVSFTILYVRNDPWLVEIKVFYSIQKNVNYCLNSYALFVTIISAVLGPRPLVSKEIDELLAPPGKA